jgi:RNA polymerase sigma-70 factor (ECF subfamily)
MVAQNSSPFSAPSSRPITDRAARAAVSRQEALYDATLVHRFNAGDEAAFIEIVTRYRAKLLAVALGLLRNHADAEEIAQDAFIRAHRGLARFRGDSSLSAWLHCITLNLSRNRYWYFYRRRRHTTQSLDCAISADNQATFADLVACNSPGPVREAATREFSALVTECMTKLSAGQRGILMLRNVRQHSYRDIAQTLGISIGTVKSRIGRARRELRLKLAKEYPEFDPEVSPSEWFDPARSIGRQEVACA